MNKELKIKKLLSELDNARVGMALGKLNHIKKLTQDLEDFIKANKESK